jgi:hypothetical protein
MARDGGSLGGSTCNSPEEVGSEVFSGIRVVEDLYGVGTLGRGRSVEVLEDLVLFARLFNERVESIIMVSVLGETTSALSTSAGISFTDDDNKGGIAIDWFFKQISISSRTPTSLGSPFTRFSRSPVSPSVVATTVKGAPKKACLVMTYSVCG